MTAPHGVPDPSLAPVLAPGVPAHRDTGTTPEHVRDAFLLGYHTPTTKAAYREDLRWWFEWLYARGVNPLAAHRIHVDAWVADLMERGLRPATISRKVSAIRLFYEWAVDQDILVKSPVPPKGRSLHLPKVSRKSQTLGPDRIEGRAIYAAAMARSLRDGVIVSLLLHQGLRATELCDLDRDHVTSSRGHRILRLHRKGGEEQDQVLSPPAATALDAYLAERGDGYPPLVLADPKTKTFPRLHRNHVAWTVRAVSAAAGVDKELTPHSLRHACTTQLLDEGVPLRDVQVFMGHAHSTTTERYDLGRNTLDGSPAYRIAGVWSA